METQEKLLEAGAAIGNPKQVPNSTGNYAIIPEDYQLQSLEKLSLTPDRKKGKVQLDDADSFIRYFNGHQGTASTIYGKVNPPLFVGVLNDHDKDSPGWMDHRVTYECPFSVEWREWASNDKKVMKQAEFADFIERNLLNIVEPEGAEMLEISRSLQAKKKVNFSSGIRLSNGQQELTYEEEIQGTSARGKLQIPEIFTLGLPVLDGGDGYRVEARLRYRINDAVLVMWYELVRPHKVIEDAVNSVWEKIESGTDRKIYKGTI